MVISSSLKITGIYRHATVDSAYIFCWEVYNNDRITVTMSERTEIDATDLDSVKTEQKQSLISSELSVYYMCKH